MRAKERRHSVLEPAFYELNSLVRGLRRRATRRERAFLDLWPRRPVLRQALEAVETEEFGIAVREPLRESADTLSLRDSEFKQRQGRISSDVSDGTFEKLPT